jgi:hypothetical protein
MTATRQAGRAGGLLQSSPFAAVQAVAAPLVSTADMVAISSWIQFVGGQEFLVIVVAK